MATEDDFAQTWKDAINADTPAQATAADKPVTKPLEVSSGVDRMPVDSTMTPEQQYASIWQNEQNGIYGDQMVNPAPLPVDPTAGAQTPATPAADASQGADDYRLPVPMTEEQFMAARYNPLDNGDRDKKLEPYWTFEEYADAWYKSDDSKLVNRKPPADAAKPAAPATGSIGSAIGAAAGAPGAVSQLSSGAAVGGLVGSITAPASQVIQTKPLQVASPPATPRPAATPAMEERFA